ncbi:MAG: DNA polymerase I [Bacilli bacterium]|jgi:DNA polymerase-1|nr:DNA polymerase I [Bacilli bacterium]
MKRVILVDGNNLMFRSYYATAYSGNIMKNSKGFPTNALYGFVSMMNKIINEEKPEYIAVAFDIGKNFRKEKYDFYKEGRSATPDELKSQMPIARDILTAMGIKYLELAPYEADDIIGTLARMADEDPEVYATIVSSDRDLLQLISPVVDVKLLKQKDYIRYNPETFLLDWGIEPIKIIDLKALAGDSSDNIPGVKGIGDKTALKLLQEYGSLEGIYDNIENIKGKTREKLETDKENAFMSKEIATIYREVPLDIEFEGIKYLGTNEKELASIYEELEFYSLLKNFDRKSTAEKNIEFKEIKDINEVELGNEVSIYIELDEENYHKGNILGIGVSDKEHNYYIESSMLKDLIPLLKDKVVYTYNAKALEIIMRRNNLELAPVNYDLMIAAYLVNAFTKDDIAYLMNPQMYSVEFYENNAKNNFADKEKLKKEIVLKSRFIYDTRDIYINELKKEAMYELFANIEMPLTYVLADMEYIGVPIDSNILDEIKAEAEAKLEIITKEIYNMAGCVFNISSPKQLGEVIYGKLGIAVGKKTQKGYKTDADTLKKLIDRHPIINLILEYRNFSKILSTYTISLENAKFPDNKIHTIFKQTLTRTGRLSSVEPNLQNIPIRGEEGRKVRRAFIPSNDLFLSIDYSQIELRILAHISDSKELIEAFRNGQDIHTKVAADIYGVEEGDVTKLMRSTAKAVIFGIVYGISGFGLGENLNIDRKQAQEFINKYYELYPGVKNYMDNIVKEAYETGSVRTLFNRKRTIEELNNKNYMIRSSGERIALNTPIQGTSADIIKKAMVLVFEEFKKANIKSKMVLQIHDELVIDTIKEEEEQVTEIVKNVMENVIELSVPLKVGIAKGKDLYEAK